MELPLCRICVKKGVFCLSCQEKIDKGLYNTIDIRMINYLYDINYKGNLEYIKTYPFKNRLKLVVKGIPNKFFYKVVIPKLEKKTNKKVDLINLKDNEEIVLKKILYPYNIISKSILYSLGEEKIKVKLNIKLKNKDKKDLQELVKKILNKEVVIE